MENSPYCSKIIYSSDPETELEQVISGSGYKKVFLATEDNVDRLWVSQFDRYFDNRGIKKVIVPSGEQNKKIDSVLKIWQFLSENGADRKSLLINFGGGMLTDMAAFAATTFKRGIDFLNIPTTLLSQVDASVGGKTGINLNGLKNEIGTFCEPVAVIIDTYFLKTLDRQNFMSGYAEMIKHGLIHNPGHLAELLEFDIQNMDYTLLRNIIQHSVNVKEYFVSNDPTEKNIRKALNFGHTAGHAFESYAMQTERAVLHGFAVAYGMVVELFLSVKKCGLSTEALDKMTNWLLDNYGKFEITENDFEPLFRLMQHDKKNETGKINFSLLSHIGKTEINQDCGKELIFESLWYYQTR